MRKKSPIGRFSKPKAKAGSADRTWHNGADVEIRFYARSLQKAARALVEKWELDQNAKTDWDGCPVILLYREALELHLKALVGEGSNFLKTRTDPISLSRTHSLRWLAQLVCQIIRTVGWERDLTCGGISSLADFNALVNEVESFDPVGRANRSSRAKDPNSVSQYYRTFNVAQFATKLDALLDMLDVTADALAATWDQREAAENQLFAGDDFDHTIQ